MKVTQTQSGDLQESNVGKNLFLGQVLVSDLFVYWEVVSVDPRCKVGSPLKFQRRNLLRC